MQVIAQTADFVREAGGQSEFRLGVAQAGNPNFAFLRPDDRLFPYYRWLLQANPRGAHQPERSASLQGEDSLLELCFHAQLSYWMHCSGSGTDNVAPGSFLARLSLTAAHI